MSILSRPFNALFLIGLLSAVWIAYWPSLEHVPRADQWAYLVDTRNCESLSDLWTKSYSYNRVRAVGPGDTDLFRPILFALLCLEKYCFGNNFVPSQALGVALHGTIIVLLFFLLQRVARRSTAAAWPLGFRLLPHAVTAFFALNFASMELVVWAHLHGYLLFLVFVLGAFLLISPSAPGSDDTDRTNARRSVAFRLTACWLLTFLSAFTYELGQFLAVILTGILGVALWRSGKAAALRIGLCFLLIVAIYQATNAWDRGVHRGQFPEEDLQEQILHKVVSLDTFEHAGRFLAFTTVQPFFPSVTGWWYQGERIHIQEPVFSWIKYVQPNLKLAISYAVALLFFGLSLWGAWRLGRDGLRSFDPVLIAALGMFGLYAAITVLGRMNMRPSHFVLCSNSYYTYLSLLFFLVAAFAVWQQVPLSSARWAKIAWPSLAAGLIFLACYSSGRIYHAADRLRTRYAEFHAAVRDVEAFIAEHRHEPDFRLAFDVRPDDPFPVTHSIPFSNVLFARWIDNHEPSYVISFPDSKFQAVSATEHRLVSRQRERPEEDRQLFPDLVRVGSDYNIHFWRGKFYGTLHWDDVFRPGLKDYSYVIEGDTLQAVLDMVPVRYEEFMEDLRTGWCIPPRMGIEVLEEDYAGFEMVHAGAYYYAVPAAEGPFEINRFNARRYSTAFVADDVETLQRYVNEHRKTARPRQSVHRQNNKSRMN